MGTQLPIKRMFLLRCPCTCDRAYLLPASAAGQTFHCPMTGQPIRLPPHLPRTFGEEQWETCDRPRILLSCLRMLRGPLSERRLRLLTVAVSRRGEAPTSADRWSAFLATAERWADGQLLEPERRAAAAEADGLAAQMVVTMGRATWPARLLPLGLRSGPLAQNDLAEQFLEQSAEESDPIRELAGNPFHLRRLLMDWLTWNDRAVPHMAATIYEDRAWDRLPILADALEDAGCIDDPLLSHLRGPGPHVRGCWALDLLLGRS
jgi:hypothetical protein